ncbi:MAG: outer membrane protein transport protein [Gammaproteobacteria bacterium]|nr:outer membrane protein transport protein [Gammaproteobacteria bacterium]
MAKRFAVKKLLQLMCVGGVLGLSSGSFASGFQLWEQDGASIGDYHAGRSAQANDASTSWYNPAGITRFNHQQIVFGDVAILSDFRYKGTVALNTLTSLPPNATAQGGGFTNVPDLHYVSPINDKIGFGFSIVAPFGLKTEYGRTSSLRYAAISSQIRVVDISPAFAVNLAKNFSVGLGLDWQRASAQFSFQGALGALGPNSDTESMTKGRSIGYGLHGGMLYQFIPSTRVGLAYNSQVVHHLRGTSKATGPVANFFNKGPIVSTNALVALTLPAYTTLSLYHQLNPQWALMGSAIFTQWTVFKRIRIQNFSGVQSSAASNKIIVNIPASYKNTWNFSVGSEYAATEKFTLRSGVGFDESPVPTKYRNVQIPDNNRYALALGGHYQATKTIGFDMGWTHLFFPNKTTVNPPPQPAGSVVVTTNGLENGSADVLGAQVTWDIA